MTEKISPNEALNPSTFIHEINQSDAYFRAMNELVRLPEAEKPEAGDRRRIAVRLASAALSTEQVSGFKSLDSHAFNVIHHLTEFTESQRALADIRAHHGSYNEKHPYVEKMVGFNHAIKEMVDAYPALQFDRVMSFLRHMHQALDGADRNKHFETEVRGILVGVRHEIGVEQMLGTMRNVEYETGAVSDDIKGADLYVSIDGSPMTPFDIKASPTKTFYAKNEAPAKGHNPDHIIWSHIEDREFGNSFRIPYTLAAERAPELYKDLYTGVFPNEHQKRA